MYPLSTSQVLMLWERGLGQSPIQRALNFAQAASPGTLLDQVATLSIGERDGSILDLRESVFGARMTSIAACPRCGEKLELAFETNDIRSADSGRETGTEELRLEMDSYMLRFRLPNSEDVSRAAAIADPSASRRLLLDRCTLEATAGGAPASTAELPDAILDAVEEGMAKADPYADLNLDLDCPACSHRWRAPFDIAAFFWNELEAWALGVLHDVHTLATAYGWSEPEILSLSPTRRQFYLEMVS